MSCGGVIIEISDYFSNRFYYVVRDFGDEVRIATNYSLIIDSKNYRWLSFFFY
jgi:hypothetical protein